ncbi:MAG TPA: MerR family transcriptional regulator [Polyangiaceae bacterium]
MSTRSAPADKPDEDSPRRRDGLLTTGDMARLSGSTLRTVRFYEEAGILVPQHRTEGGHRLFGAWELKKLALVTDLRAAGFSLESIKELLDMKDTAASGAEAVNLLLARLNEQLATITERLTVLQRVKDSLSGACQYLERCKDCTSSPLFPKRCAECERFHGDKELPSAVGVLWKLDRTE